MFRIGSHSLRSAWIEILEVAILEGDKFVALLTECVDRNRSSVTGGNLDVWVALLTECVDRNHSLARAALAEL